MSGPTHLAAKDSVFVAECGAGGPTTIFTYTREAVTCPACRGPRPAVAVIEAALEERVGSWAEDVLAALYAAGYVVLRPGGQS